jgi:hypothetical protein
MIGLSTRLETLRWRRQDRSASARVRSTAADCVKLWCRAAHETRESLTSTARLRANHNILCGGEWSGGAPLEIPEVRMGTPHQVRGKLAVRRRLSPTPDGFAFAPQRGLLREAPRSRGRGVHDFRQTKRTIPFRSTAAGPALPVGYAGRLRIRAAKGLPGEAGDPTPLFFANNSSWVGAGSNHDVVAWRG